MQREEDEEDNWSRGEKEQPGFPQCVLTVMMTCRTLQPVNRLQGRHFFTCRDSSGCGFRIRPSHTLRCCTPGIRCSKASAMQKIVCDALRCKFQHFQYFAPDFGISQVFSIRFSNSLRHCDKDLMSFYVIYGSTFSVKYF